MKRMEVRPFSSKVGNNTLTGTVSGKYKEISDYYVKVEVDHGKGKYHFEFEMIMVAIPAMYVVNRIAFAGAQPIPIATTQRMQAAQCFEHTLLHIVDTVKEMRQVLTSSEAITP